MQNRIVLTAKAEGSQLQQQTLVRMETDVAEGFDPRYDSRFMAGYAPEFFCVTENERLSTLAVSELTDDLVIPMVFRKNHEGKQFIVSLSETIPGTEI